MLNFQCGKNGCTGVVNGKSEVVNIRVYVGAGRGSGKKYEDVFACQVGSCGMLHREDGAPARDEFGGKVFLARGEVICR